MARTKDPEAGKPIHKPGEAPDGGFGWIVVAATFMQHVISLGVAYTLGVYYPSFQEELGTDAATTAWVAAAHLGMLFCSGPAAGWLLTKLGTAEVSFLGAVVCGAGCIASGFFKSIWTVILCLGFISGFGNGFLFIAAVTAVTRWFNKKRSLATGLAVCGAGFGVFGFAPMIRYFIDLYGWQWAVRLQGAIAFHGCIFALFLRPVPDSTVRRLPSKKKKATVEDVQMKIYNGDTVYKSDHHENGEAESLKPLHEITDPEPAPVEISRPRANSVIKDALTMKAMYTNWMFWLFCLSQFLTFFSASGPLVFLYNRAFRDLQIAAMDAALIISMMGVFNTVGRLLFGILGNVFPRSRPYLLGGWITAFGAATALSVFGTSYWSIIVHACVFGAGYGCMFALSTVVLVDYFGITLFGKIYGFIGIFRGVACMIGPPLGGWIITQTGYRHDVLFLFTGTLGILGGIAQLLTPLLLHVVALRKAAHTRE